MMKIIKIIKQKLAYFVVLTHLRTPEDRRRYESTACIFWNIFLSRRTHRSRVFAPNNQKIVARTRTMSCRKLTWKIISLACLMILNITVPSTNAIFVIQPVFRSFRSYVVFAVIVSSATLVHLCVHTQFGVLASNISPAAPKSAWRPKG